LEEVMKANPGVGLSDALLPKYGGGFKHVHMWMSQYVGFPGLRFMAEPCVDGLDCSDADQLSSAEFEGRRQIRALFDVVRARFKDGEKLKLAALASYIGVRETRRCEALHRLTEKELLTGVRFPDAIANGCYPVDVHNEVGLVFKYLDGRQRTQRYSTDGSKAEMREERWLPEGAPHALFYQIPYRSLVPKGAKNVLCAGRLVDSTRGRSAPSA
jgi:hypothetical protein